MGAPSVGDIVLVPFPFSDLSGTKKRPALLLAEAGRDDWVCLQVTSQPYGDEAAILLTDKDFARGTLRRVSYLRPGKLFTAHRSLFVGNVARVDAAKLAQARESVIALIKRGAFQQIQE